MHSVYVELLLLLAQLVRAFHCQEGLLATDSPVRRRPLDGRFRHHVRDLPPHPGLHDVWTERPERVHADEGGGVRSAEGLADCREADECEEAVWRGVSGEDEVAVLGVFVSFCQLLAVLFVERNRAQGGDDKLVLSAVAVLSEGVRHVEASEGYDAVDHSLVEKRVTTRYSTCITLTIADDRRRAAGAVSWQEDAAMGLRERKSSNASHDTITVNRVVCVHRCALHSKHIDPKLGANVLDDLLETVPRGILYLFAMQ